MQIKDIDGWEGYKITSTGIVIGKRVPKLAGKIDRYGYHQVLLVVGSRRKYTTVHRLVANAFIDNPYGLPAVNHKDGNKLHNIVSNLEWVSNSDNFKHAINTGIYDPRGEGNSFSRLTNKEVAEMYAAFLCGTPIKTIFNDNPTLSVGCISKICYGESWKHITQPIKQKFRDYGLSASTA
jgi:hypothetical protein